MGFLNMKNLNIIYLYMIVSKKDTKETTKGTKKVWNIVNLKNVSD